MALLGALALVRCAALPQQAASQPSAVVAPHAPIPKGTWLRLGTTHFDIVSDHDVDELKRWAIELEQLYGSLLALTSFGFDASVPPPTARIAIVWFTDEDDFKRIAISDNVAAQFMWGDPPLLTAKTVALHGRFNDNGRATLLHELTHSLTHHYLPQVPLWLNEGLAQYFETLRVKDGMATFGALRGNRMYGFARTRTSSLPKTHELATALRYPKDDLALGDFYAASLILTHLLNDTTPIPAGTLTGRPWREAFIKYVNALASGAGAEGAYQELLRCVDHAALDSEYREHILSAEKRQWQTQAPALSTIRVAAPVLLSADDVHIVWARLLLSMKKPDAARVHLQAAQASAERDVLFALIEVDAERQKRMTDAIERWPKDEMLRLFAVMKSEKQTNGEFQALVPLAKHPYSLAYSAHFFAAKGQLAKGMDFATRAIKADRTCALCWRVAGHILKKSGNTAQAIQALEWSLVMLPDGKDDPKTRQELEEWRASSASAPVRETPEH